MNIVDGEPDVAEGDEISTPADPKLPSIPISFDVLQDVLIDNEEDQEMKYILLDIMNVRTYKTRTLIRASKDCESHIDIFKKFMMQEIGKMPDDEKIGK